MSSEDSDHDDKGVLNIYPPSWRSEAFEELIAEIDEHIEKKKTEHARRITKKRVIQDEVEKEAPENAPKEAVFA